jgi:6-pyruvoyltetrahydropterin/6-carboxytetrahydropterin synthase
MSIAIQTAERYHDISCGHRVYGHESKCAHLHGHNYRIHFSCVGPLDSIGRVLDFSVMKSQLCMWVEQEWDHKCLLWQEDPWVRELEKVDPTIVVLPFNPTAENMARYLCEILGPMQLAGTPVALMKVVVEETRKCQASHWIPPELAHQLRRTFEMTQSAQRS